MRQVDLAAPQDQHRRTARSDDQGPVEENEAADFRRTVSRLRRAAARQDFTTLPPPAVGRTLGPKQRHSHRPRSYASPSTTLPTATACSLGFLATCLFLLALHRFSLLMAISGHIPPCHPPQSRPSPLWPSPRLSPPPSPSCPISPLARSTRLPSLAASGVGLQRGPPRRVRLGLWEGRSERA